MKKIFSLENLLSIFIIMCPIFDIASFLFRNYFSTTISVSTFVRPIIPIVAGIIIFIKLKKQDKKKLIILAIIYLFYAVVHLYTTKTLLTGCSYGTINNELQYIFNFTFLIIDLIVYELEFKNGDMSKLKKSIAIMLAIYILSIYIAILTKTSSPTYTETGVGYKGWIESGNSLSAILVLSLFIVLPQLDFKKWKIKKGTTIQNKEKDNLKVSSDEIKLLENNNDKVIYNNTKSDFAWQLFILITIIMTGIYLTTLIGTRVGLFGTFIAFATYIALEVIFSKNKKILIGGGIIIIIGIIAISILGSKTLQRRKEVKAAQSTIIDESTGEVGNMTGDMLKLKNKILAGTLEDGYMSEAQSKSVIDLYEYAKAHNLAGNDTRTQQLMYNIYLVKNQRNILAIFFGNGYKANFREMVMENELASMLLNFGIFGFILYVMPFIAIIIYSIIIAIKNIKEKNMKNIDTEYVMYQCAVTLALALSWLSGYVLFASSSMIVITIASVLLLKKMYKKG